MNKELLIKQLDKWIDDCEKQSKIFEEYNFETSKISSEAMAQAYWNVKQLLEVNN